MNSPCEQMFNIIALNGLGMSVYLDLFFCCLLAQQYAFYAKFDGIKFIFKSNM